MELPERLFRAISKSGFCNSFSCRGCSDHSPYTKWDCRRWRKWRGKSINAQGSGWDCHQKYRRSLSTVGARLSLPLRSIVEEYKISKIRTQWSLNNSKDNRVREVMPQLRSGRKFGAQEEIEKSQAILDFEEIRGSIQVDRHGVGWNRFERWSTASAPTKAAMIIQERRRQRETERNRSGSATKPTRPMDNMGWGPPKIRHMERHLANVSPPFGIHDQIGLWCILSQTNWQKWGIIQELLWIIINIIII